MRFEQLTSKNEHFKTICNWMYNWWGVEDGWSYEKVEYFMSNCLQKDRIPQTYLMFWEDKVVGMYQFSNEDCDVRPDIYPWLINVYIDEPYRNKGLFKYLIENCLNNATKLDKLYLFTEHVGLYEKYGFEFIELFPTFKENDYKRLYMIDINNKIS